MSEARMVQIRIGRYAVTTTEATARKIVADPALLLRLYEMMVESAQVLHPDEEADDA